MGVIFFSLYWGNKQNLHLYLPGKPLLLSFVISDPETPTSQSRKRKRSEDQDIKFDDIKLGEIYTVTVKSVKTLQLNVQLSRKVGEILWWLVSFTKLLNNRHLFRDKPV